MSRKTQKRVEAHRIKMDKKHARAKALKEEAAQLLDRAKAACAKTNDKISESDLAVFAVRPSRGANAQMLRVALINEEMAEHFDAKKAS